MPTRVEHESSSDDGKVLDGVEGDGKPCLEDDSWNNSELVHELPVLSVTQPDGAFCHINARFSVALPPNEVYDIIVDPNNRRVFKNIKEVTYRKVLEDDGNRQLVEVEQVARWRFLIFSGSIPCRVLVEQKREECMMLFDLARQGMMKKFSGSWKIDPMTTATDGTPADADATGSWVELEQTVEPAMIPPWPLNSYVRGVTAKIVKEICHDLQAECLRLSTLKRSS